MINLIKIDVRGVLTPSIMIFFSCVANTFLQVYLSGKSWSTFNIFSVSSSYNIVYLYLFLFLFFVIGSFVGRMVVSFYSGRSSCRAIYYIKYRWRFLLFDWLFFLSGLFFLIFSQWSMGASNLYNLYIVNSVSAQDIEQAINSSAFGVHGLLILWGYSFVLYFGICRFVKRWSWLTLLSSIISVLAFLSMGKVQSLLYFIFALIFFSRKKISLFKFSIYLLLIVSLFVVTRLIRNPDMDLIFNADFLLRFIGGFYFGSPVVNTTFLWENQMHNIQYAFNWLIPQKIMPPSDVSKLFPDATSPIGFFGTALYSFWPFSWVYVGLIGMLCQVIMGLRMSSLACYIFCPFMIVTCFFSMMYNNFLNLTFFIMPLIISFVLPRALGIRKYNM